MSLKAFNFPQIYSFPPFFTRQIHEETWRKQREYWIEIILGYCEAGRVFEIDLSNESTYQLPLFFNSSIDRRMDKEFLKEVMDEMVRREKAAWIPGNRINNNISTYNNSVSLKSKVLILWHRPAEWAQIVYKCVDRTGGIGSIYTVYDLFEGEDYTKEEFHQIPETLIRAIISELERTGKVALFADPSTTSNFKETGLKFM